MKKIFALLLALTLVLSLSAMAFADTTYTISVPSTDDHSYDVYQIFTGDLFVDNGKEILSNIKYGANAKLPTGAKVGDLVPEATLDALTAVASSTSDTEKLAVINQYVDLTTKLTTVSKTISCDAAPGYYLIKDTSTFEPKTDEAGRELETYSEYIVQVVNTVEINRKASLIPEDKKEIIENGEAVTVNDVKIGDTVHYKITATVPEKIQGRYDYYYFIITDKLEEGLTLQASTITVTTADRTMEAGTDYTLDTTATDDATFQVALIDALSNEGKTIYVDFDAIVNEKATMIDDPNSNTEHVKFSDNPNTKYDGTTDESKPGFPDSDKTVPLGETPDKKVDSYSTTLTVHKVDENGKVLTGAEFTLTGDTNQIRVVTAEKFEADPNGAYYKLNNGKYTKEAPVTEAYMKPAAVGATKGYVVAETDYSGTDTVTVGGTVYRPVKATDSGKDVYILVEVNEDDYESTNNKYKRVTISYDLKGAETEQTTISGAVNTDGTVTFEGLGAGTYKLTESVTPPGYNTIAPIDFTVSFDKTTKKFSSTSPITVGSDNALETTVVNEKGTVLPETGGIGTTIFYVVGAVLVAGAAIVLFARKRAEE